MMKLAAALVALLLIASPVNAVEGTITLDQAQPVHAGDTVTFTTTLTGTSRNSTSYVWVICEQPDYGGSVALNVRQPRGTAFVLASPTWNASLGARCSFTLVYEVTYGGGKVKHNYLGESSFVVAP